MGMAGGSAGHGLGRTRARVLHRLAEFEGGVGTSALATDLGLHDNTVRFHLEALVRAGYAVRSLEQATRQGRPRALYRATASAPLVDTTHLRDLTQVLVRQLVLGSRDPRGTAEDVGRAWGAEVAGTPVAGSTGGNGIAALLEHTRSMGFTIDTPDDHTVTFHSCPYRSVSQPTLASICTMHLGMMRGYLEATGSQFGARSLTPGEVCVARLELASEGGGEDRHDRENAGGDGAQHAAAPGPPLPQ